MWYIVIGYFAVCIIGGGLGLYWRMNMMLNEPEKYERYRKYEHEYQEDMKRNFAWQGRAAKKAAGVGFMGVKLLARMLMK
jgi:hypothetical protein